MTEFDLDGCLAEIASEEPEAFPVLVRSMPRIWKLALIEEYVRAN